MRRGKTVLTSGAFDILHPGHIFLLRYARRLAGPKGKVVVVVARDSTVRRRKGRPPVLGEEARLTVVGSIRYVDEATLGYRPFSFAKIIKKYRPDVVLFGYDQQGLMKSFMEEASKRGWSIKVARAPKLSSPGASSSSLILRRVAKILSRGPQRE